MKKSAQEKKPSLTYLKWAGNKTKLAPRIARMLGGRPGRGGRHVEPFAGTGAVFLHRARQDDGIYGVLVDSNERLFRCHATVRRDPDAVWRALQDLPFDTYRETYTTLLAELNTGIEDPVRHAAVFIFVNRTCFNGLYRENKSGTINVPVGQFKSTPRPPSLEVLREAAELLGRAELRCQSFEACILETVACDQIYADPPYVPKSATADFRGYTKDGFGWEEQERLARLLGGAAERGVKVVASNHDVPLVRELYGDLGFQMTAFDVTRSINSKAERRDDKVGELLLTKNVEKDALEAA
jgi:DNA adenine methylase